MRQGLVASIGQTTIWRWLADDAIRPWRHDRLLRFQAHYEQVAKPFEWRFTRRSLEDLLRKLGRQPKVA